MSTHNICFYGEIMKIISKLSQNTPLICSTALLTLTNINTVMILIFRTDRSGQIIYTKIKLFLQEQSDQGLHLWPYCLQFWAPFCMLKPHCSNFRIITTIFSGVQIFHIFKVIFCRPCEVYFNPMLHENIQTLDALKLDANHLVVVYKRMKDTTVQRKIIQGPTVFVPEAEEW